MQAATGSELTGATAAVATYAWVAVCDSRFVVSGRTGPVCMSQPARPTEPAPGGPCMNLFEAYRETYAKARDEEMSLLEYLDLCRRIRWPTPARPSACWPRSANPKSIDTRNDPRLSRLFSNRIIRRYPAFREFYGMEEAIAQIVSYFLHAAQGLEERKQVLYLLGPVGGGKSSLAEKLKQLIESYPIYALKGSPVNESPLGLFQSRARRRRRCENEYGIPQALPDRHHEPVGDQAAAGVRRRHHQVPRRPHAAVGAAPDRHRQDRAGRREQPGHLLAGRQGRHPQARDASRRTTPTPTATRAACAWPTRACSSSSRCSRRRSRCCTRC